MTVDSFFFRCGGAALTALAVGLVGAAAWLLFWLFGVEVHWLVPIAIAAAAAFVAGWLRPELAALTWEVLALAGIGTVFGDPPPAKRWSWRWVAFRFGGVVPYCLLLLAWHWRRQHGAYPGGRSRESACRRAMVSADA